MQTFLPLPSFAASAATLDRQRLGKQRVENLQILQALAPGAKSRWRAHPATRMWAGYEPALVAYQDAVCSAWTAHGYKDTCWAKTLELANACGWLDREIEMPPWFGSHLFHRSHQSNLIRKHPSWYGKMFPGVPDDLPYIWPVEES